MIGVDRWVNTIHENSFVTKVTWPDWPGEAAATRGRKRHGRVKTGNGQDDRILSLLLSTSKSPCCQAGDSHAYGCVYDML